MSGDPFPGRCRRCGIGLLDDVEECGRGPQLCRTEWQQLADSWRALVAAVRHRWGRS